ncbi:MAG: hypothetical protein IKR22_03110, partial [Clostridiales bacterium]|nr:hypothetical protein [Clostridiales bacterium]
QGNRDPLCSTSHSNLLDIKKHKNISCFDPIKSRIFYHDERILPTKIEESAKKADSSFRFQ